jgi:hypothetical protein
MPKTSKKKTLAEEVFPPEITGVYPGRGPDRTLEDYEYLKTLSPEEISREGEELVELAVKLANLEEEKQSLQAEIKSRIEPLKQEYAIKVSIVRTGKKTVREEVLVYFDRERLQADYFNQEGEVILSRALTPEELQTKLFND